MNTDQRIIELETKLAYQEDLLQSLNASVYDHQQRLTKTEAKNEQLFDFIKELVAQMGEGGSGGDGDQPPPHY